jgi:hypothetical protein
MKHRPLPRRLVSTNPALREKAEASACPPKPGEGWKRRLVRPGVFTDNELRAESEFGAPRQYQAAPPVCGLLKNAFFRSSRSNEAQISLETIIRLEPPYAGCCFFNGLLAGEVEIRAAHEIMAARAAQLALSVGQFMTALRTPPPVLAGNVFVRRRGAGVGFGPVVLAFRSDIGCDSVIASFQIFSPVRVNLPAANFPAARSVRILCRPVARQSGRRREFSG